MQQTGAFVEHVVCTLTYISQLYLRWIQSNIPVRRYHIGTIHIAFVFVVAKVVIIEHLITRSVGSMGGVTHLLVANNFTANSIRCKILPTPGTYPPGTFPSLHFFFKLPLQLSSLFFLLHNRNGGMFGSNVNPRIPTNSLSSI